jgi:hypothetical protein
MRRGWSLLFYVKNLAKDSDYALSAAHRNGADLDFHTVARPPNGLAIRSRSASFPLFSAGRSYTGSDVCFKQRRPVSAVPACSRFGGEPDASLAQAFFEFLEFACLLFFPFARDDAGGALRAAGRRGPRDRIAGGVRTAGAASPLRARGLVFGPIAMTMLAHRSTRDRGDGDLAFAATTLVPMAMDIDVQRLELGDVILIDLGDSEAGRVEAKVVREIDRTDATVRVTLRVEGGEDFVREWRVGDQVTVVRGP